MLQLLRLLVFGIIVYFTVTVAAFVYLEWWQAVLVSWGTFFALFYLARFLVRRTIRRLTGGVVFGSGLRGLAASLFGAKSQVLRNATVDVHSVRPTKPPVEVLSYREENSEGGPTPVEPAADWYEFDVSIYPDPRSAGPMGYWDVDDLRLVPADAVVTADLDQEEPGDEFELEDLRVVVGGEPVEPELSKFAGPQRLNFRAGVRKGLREVKFRYYFEAFGHFRLPDPLLLPVARADDPT